MISFSQILCLNACIDPCATFDSLNIGSLEIGAERKGKLYSGYESESGGLSMVMNGILSGPLRVELLVWLLWGWAGGYSGMFIDGNVMFIQQLAFEFRDQHCVS
jgi:hypothetical protein